MSINRKYDGLEIAIIGMSGHFPKSLDCSSYWKNLCEGNELLQFFSDEELLRSGANRDMIENNQCIRSAGMLTEKEYFDNVFFNYRKEEAALMDPQIRLFHEHCWKALEDAGQTSVIDIKKIGIYAGASENDNWKLYAYGKARDAMIDPFYADKISNHSYASTLVSHKLNLRGPSLSIATACSTSLVAVDIACRSLLTKECSIALAGGVKINTVKSKAYLFEQGMIESGDGHCRAFDKDASGTLFGEGVGVVVLKRLQEALNDRDHIYAIIKSSASNNDGSEKVGYTAPSVAGQADCIKMAHKLAGVDPRTISYIEAHGTGTKLGDPIEIRALNEAFNTGGNDKFCAIGSVKSSMGHLDTAAGIAGLIKTALSLKNRKIPASLNYLAPNPEIDFDGGPFYVNTELQEWKNKNNTPLRAGVSSFGIGGTNAHVILEEAPETQAVTVGRDYKVLTISAKTEESLTRYTNDLEKFLQEKALVNLDDMCYTFQVGRKHFEYRQSIAFQDREELLNSFKSNNLQIQKVKQGIRSNPVVFAFSGAGSQYKNMGRHLYENEPVFREEMDKGFAILFSLTGDNYKEILYPSSENESPLNEMKYTQSIVFLFGYCLARLMATWGVTPRYMIGHSLGEYIAACISGVFKYEDALQLIVKRALLMNKMLPGSMISIPLNEAEASKYLSKNISLAGVNGPEQVVLSGDTQSINKLIQELENAEIACTRLYTSIAGHSYMVDDLLDDYKSELQNITMYPPEIPFVSNLTGDFIKTGEATTVDYWLRHMRETVRFSDGVQSIMRDEEKKIFIEIGAGHSLISLVKQHETKQSIGINTVRHPKEQENDLKYLMDRLGKLWAFGIDINWPVFYKDEKRNKISLPTYSFEKNQFPTEIDHVQTPGRGSFLPFKSTIDPKDWFYRIVWKQSVLTPDKLRKLKGAKILIYGAKDPVSEKTIHYLNKQDALCILVEKGTGFCKITDHLFSINPSSESDYENLFAELKVNNFEPSEIIHLWNYSESQTIAGPFAERFERSLLHGYESLLKIACCFSSAFPKNTMQLTTISNGMYAVLGEESLRVEISTSLSAIKTIPKEFPEIKCRSIDIDSINAVNEATLFNEIVCDSFYEEVAIRGKKRYIKDYEKIDFNFPINYNAFQKGKSYLITGANGEMGKIISAYIAETTGANLLLIDIGDISRDWIEHLEEKGSNVIYLKLDLMNLSELKRGMSEAEIIFGEINGIINAAETIDRAGIILNRHTADIDDLCSVKIYSTELIHHFFAEKNPDFFVNCSSASASLAPFGRVANTAVNSYLDAFAEKANAMNSVISIEWPMQSIQAENKTDISDIPSSGISPTDLIAILNGALYLKLPTVIISNVDFKNLSVQSLDLNEIQVLKPNRNQIKERPELSTRYTPPETETETKLVLLIEDFFGIDKIGVEDNFFELGGDSLKAMIILKRIKKDYDVNFTLKLFFMNPTIKQISAEIDTVKLLLQKTKRESKIIL